MSKAHTPENPNWGWEARSKQDRSRFPPTTEEERADMLKRFYARGGKITKCPTAFELAQMGLFDVSEPTGRLTGKRRNEARKRNRERAEARKTLTENLNRGSGALDEVT